MTATILTPFIEHPKEAAIIGRLLAGYGELEFGWGVLLTNFLPHRTSAIKAMFRVRSESGRIDVADALIRNPIQKLALGSEYSDTLGAFRHCLKIRNQYAHCHWDVREREILAFYDMGEAVQGPGIAEIVFKTIPLPLLEEQEAFFHYTKRSIWFLDAESENRLRGPKPHDLEMPPKTPQPLLHNP